MFIRSAFLATALLAGAVPAAIAADHAGGAIMSVEANGGMMLTNDKGMTLYTFDKDEPGTSNCYGGCATMWPPAMAADGAAADGDFTLVARKDGGQQWAYRGMPLYLWKADTKPGDTKGDGVNGVWHTAME